MLAYYRVHHRQWQYTRIQIPHEAAGEGYPLCRKLEKEHGHPCPGCEITIEKVAGPEHSAYFGKKRVIRCNPPMKPDHQSQEQELNHREALLKERELKLRLRELEADLTEASPVQPRLHPRQHLSQAGYQGLPKIVKFGVLVVGVIIAVRVVAWLAGVLLLMGIIWAGYKVFIEGDRH